MHHIQRKILNKLLYAETLNYAGMRPPGIESNHFAYHLDQLVQAGLVAKKDRKYFLSSTGLALVDGMSQEKMVERVQPRIVTAMDITTKDGKSLMFKRTFQPYINRYGFPNGKIHVEETVAQAAVRELEEKTGITGVKLKHRGVVYLESRIEGVVISKVMYHLFSGQVPEAVATTESHRGSSIWADASELKDYELMPGFRAMKQMLSNKPDFFFAELSEEQIEKPHK
jgi:8-oxo-dGTP pyrophosphatase MutT (NUDIX family)